MENEAKATEITIIRGTPDHPYAKIILKDMRSGSKDRRIMQTYLANDRRSGIADRRRRSNRAD